MADFVPGRVVIDVAQRKRGKYIGYGFLPFSFSSLEELEAYPVILLKRIRKFSMTKDISARAAMHIFNMISFSIAKGIDGVDESCLWDSLEAKYMAEDTSSKKFLVSNFTNYKMTDSRPVMEQYNKLLGILGSHLRIKESLKAQDSDKLKGNNVTGPQTESRVLGAVVRLPDPKIKTLGERGIECIFVGYAEHSKAFRLYVIEPNESAVINSLIKSKDGSMVPEKVNEEVVQQPESELRKNKRHRTPKDFGPAFQLYLVEGTRDGVSNQHLYCFNVEDDPKTFDEEMKS
ncbi:hypothetical protein Tco_0720577 [Tanacetum coccineum]